MSGATKIMLNVIAAMIRVKTVIVVVFVSDYSYWRFLQLL
jgi:hypothetical protein